MCEPNYKIKSLILFLLACILLLCLAPLPYGFYVLVRFISFAIFAWFAIDSYKTKKESICFIFIILALLFQPFAKIALGRTIWNVVDILVAIWLYWFSWKIYKRSI